jgi:hypothetical protein
MLKLSSSIDSVQFILLKIWTEWVINGYILCHIKFLTMINTIVGAGAASRYGSGSDQMMRLRLRFRLRNTDLTYSGIILLLWSVRTVFWAQVMLAWKTGIDKTLTYMWVSQFMTFNQF